MAAAMEEELNEEGPLFIPKPIDDYPELLLPQPHPLLLISQDTEDSQHTFFSVSKNRYYRCRIPELINKDVYGCNGGWLVLKDRDTPECFLYNLATKEKVSLPPLEDDRQLETCILTSTPDQYIQNPNNPNEYHVIFIKMHFSKYVLRCKPSYDNVFVRQDMEFEDEAMHAYGGIIKCEDEPTLPNNGAVMCTAFCQGRLYAVTSIMDYPPFVRTLQVADDLHLSSGSKTTAALRFTPVAQIPSTKGSGSGEEFLVECCGELFFIQENYHASTRDELRKFVFEFIVFRMDFTKAKWERVYGLGNLTLFLTGSKRLNFGCEVNEAETGIKRNSIYFTEWNNRNLYRYDMEEQSITICLPDPKIARCDPLTSWIVLN